MHFGDIVVQAAAHAMLGDALPGKGLPKGGEVALLRYPDRRVEDV